MVELIIGLTVTVGGVLLLVVPPILRWAELHSRRRKLAGVWLSSYQSVLEKARVWVTEEATVSLGFDVMRIVNDTSNGSYGYKAWARVRKDNSVVGEWESTQDGATARGYYLLTLSEAGDMMYGYWDGPTLGGERRYAPWVLARTSTRLDQAMQLLSFADMGETPMTSA